METSGGIKLNVTFFFHPIDEDKRLLLKSLPAKATGNASSNASSTSTLHEVSRSVICDLLNFLVRSPVELPELKKVSENVPNDVSHKPTMSGANRTQQVIVRNSSSIELQVSVPGMFHILLNRNKFLQIGSISVAGEQI